MTPIDKLTPEVAYIEVFHVHVPTALQKLEWESQVTSPFAGKFYNSLLFTSTSPSLLLELFQEGVSRHLLCLN